MLTSCTDTSAIRVIGADYENSRLYRVSVGIIGTADTNYEKFFLEIKLKLGHKKLKKCHYLWKVGVGNFLPKISAHDWPFIIGVIIGRIIGIGCFNNWLYAVSV